MAAAAGQSRAAAASPAFSWVLASIADRDLVFRDSRVFSGRGCAPLVLLAVMAWLIAAACVAVGARRLRRILVLAAETDALLSDLRKSRRAGERWSDYPRIVRELGPVLGAESSEQSVAALNERLGDVARELSVGAELPAVSARIGLFACVILAVIELSRTLAEPGGAALGTSGAALAAGITGALMGFDLDRRTRDAANRARGAWNTLSSLISGAEKNRIAGSRV